jgi:hypothetical protein
MERFEKIRRSFYEFPATQNLKTKGLKTETYPIRYPERFYICPSSRVAFRPTTPKIFNNETEDKDFSSKNLKINEDSTFALKTLPIVVVATTSAPSSTITNSEPDNKTQLNSRSNKLATRKCRPRNTARYMTQPITLIEIKELEEDLTSNNSYDTPNQ